MTVVNLVKCMIKFMKQFLYISLEIIGHVYTWNLILQIHTKSFSSTVTGRIIYLQAKVVNYRKHVESVLE